MTSNNNFEKNERWFYFDPFFLGISTFSGTVRRWTFGGVLSNYWRKLQWEGRGQPIGPTQRPMVVAFGKSDEHSHRIHVWYIYLHLVDIYGKCR